MRSFITGGAGFIGSCMADRLLLGPANSVTVFDNLSSAGAGNIEHIPEGNRFQVIRGDLKDPAQLQESMQGHDIVYHFASNPDIARGAEDTSLDLNLSVVATYNVLEAMRKCAVKKIVFLSGSGVYGDQGANEIGEDFGPLLPVSAYGAGKLGAEAFISAYTHLFGISSYIFRLANVVGAKQTHGVAFDFIRKLRQEPWSLSVLGDGKQSKSYIHVDDVLDAIFFVMAMVEDRINIFNVSTDDSIEVSWIADAVIKAMRLSSVTINYASGARGWPGDVPVVRLDSSKIRRFGWTPRYNSQEAMQLAIDQMLDYLKQKEAKLEAH